MAAVMLQFNFDKTIVDSGTTNFRLPNKVFDAVTTKIAEHTNVSHGENFVKGFNL